MATMKLLNISLAIVLFHSVRTIAANNDDNVLYQIPFQNRSYPQPQPRVFWGTTAPPYVPATYYAHLVFPKKNRFPEEKYTCSGVIFEPQLILTCAHCVEEAVASGWSVFAESETYPGYFIERNVQAYQFHNLYQYDKSFDLAVVAVTKPFPDSIKPALFNDKNHLMPLDQWVQCQMAGAGQTFDAEKEKCVNTKRLRYMSGILINKQACDETLRLARGPKPEGNQWPFGTACFYNNSDQFCHGDSGAGIMCRTLEEQDHVLVGLARAGPACCNQENENRKLNDPLPRNMVILDRGKRNWIQSLTGHFGLYKRLPSEAKKSNQQPPDYLD